MKRKGTVLLWRWRRNPLRRRSDVAEAWIGVAAWGALLVGVPAAAALTATGAASAMLRQAEELRPVAAEVTEDVPESHGLHGGRSPASVRWAGEDGAPGTGWTLLGPGTPAGTRVTVWVDGEGRVQPEPPPPAVAWAGGAVLGAAAAAGTGLAVVGLRHGARARLEARCRERWEREWAEIAPQWCRGA
ncbi:hypothetical protein RM780_10485 [Streptomyces sp. DSM 44917]|uniref:Proline rich protein membrane protein n=1 Tax=Streptomyces boetiae TaxID=3075541 RepID=A0ABU2L742_9ACTN|nr:hypothetical protein [Streptomyces sp. DSM 44917]MDT0307389.1 hypothetical protein [Streptomyces sp. DSM 44917]